MRVYQDDIYTFILEKMFWDRFKLTRLCSYRPFLFSYRLLSARVKSRVQVAAGNANI